MRKLLYLVSFAFLMLGCGDDPNPELNTKVDEVQDIVTAGRWRISSFINDDKDETSDYTGYIFQFQPTGVLIATNGPASLSGSWVVTEQRDGSDGTNTFDDIDFDISFASAPVLSKLSEDWEIIEATDTKIDLRHMSGGNGDTDLLTFNKI